MLPRRRARHPAVVAVTRSLLGTLVQSKNGITLASHLSMRNFFAISVLVILGASCTPKDEPDREDIERGYDKWRSERIERPAPVVEADQVLRDERSDLSKRLTALASASEEQRALTYQILADKQPGYLCQYWRLFTNGLSPNNPAEVRAAYAIALSSGISPERISCPQLVDVLLKASVNDDAQLAEAGAAALDLVTRRTIATVDPSQGTIIPTDLTGEQMEQLGQAIDAAPVEAVRAVLSGTLHRHRRSLDSFQEMLDYIDENNIELPDRVVPDFFEENDSN